MSLNRKPRDRSSRAPPQFQRDLDLTTTGLAWVVNGYTVTYGGALMLGGRLGDLLGRRRLFLTDLAIFALSSASAGWPSKPVYWSPAASSRASARHSSARRPCRW
ncbi:MFS transporter [Streptomyces antimycoticus]